MDAELRSRLQSIGLGAYISNFEEQGYDSWDLVSTLHHAELVETAVDCELDASATQRFVDYMLMVAGPLSAAEVRIDEPPPPQRRPHHQHTMPPSLGLACMTKQPPNMESWLRHHRERIGVTHFFLRVEETPELATLFAQPPWRDCVHATFADGRTARDCGGLQCVRQDAHIAWAIEAARKLGCTHLLHCDDDELLHAPSGSAVLHDALQSHPSRTIELHARVLEALYPSSSIADPFAEATVFRHKPAEMGRYGWQRGSTGKSIGVLGYEGLAPSGPHHFRAGRAEDGLPHKPEIGGFLDFSQPLEATLSENGTLVLPPSVAVILHFESSGFETWLGKYTEQLRFHRLVRQSREFERMRDEYATGASDAALLDHLHAARRQCRTKSRST